MKSRSWLAALIILMTAGFLKAQYQWAKTPIKDGQFVHVQDRPVTAYVQPGYAGASGVWVDTDRKNPPAGPSVSDISCVQSEATCHEAQANIIGFPDGTFTLKPDSMEYHVARWNSREVVAKSKPVGICHVLNVIRIDLNLKKVYLFQTLSEPVDEHMPKLSKEFCKSVGSTWELHAETPFSMKPDAKTLVAPQTQ